jgi:hypothetical protein
MYINSKELDAIQGAIDFISHHADWAEDYTPFEEMQECLRSVWKKGIKEAAKVRVKGRHKRYLAKLKKQPINHL